MGRRKVAENSALSRYQTIPLLIVASLWYLIVVSFLSVGQHFLERHYRQRT